MCGAQTLESHALSNQALGWRSPHPIWGGSRSHPRVGSLSYRPTAGLPEPTAGAPVRAAGSNQTSAQIGEMLGLLRHIAHTGVLSNDFGEQLSIESFFGSMQIEPLDRQQWAARTVRETMETSELSAPAIPLGWIACCAVGSVRVTCLGLRGSIDVESGSDSKDGDKVSVVVDPVADPVGAATCAVSIVERWHQALASPDIAQPPRARTCVRRLPLALNFTSNWGSLVHASSGSPPSDHSRAQFAQATPSPSPGVPRDW